MNMYSQLTVVPYLWIDETGTSLLMAFDATVAESVTPDNRSELMASRQLRNSLLLFSVNLALNSLGQKQSQDKNIEKSSTNRICRFTWWKGALVCDEVDDDVVTCSSIFGPVCAGPNPDGQRDDGRGCLKQNVLF